MISGERPESRCDKVKSSGCSRHAEAQKLIRRRECLLVKADCGVQYASVIGSVDLQ